MKTYPKLETERLVLRPFESGDVDAIVRYAGDVRVSTPVQNVPHPYTPEMARHWLERHEPEFQAGKSVCLAITVKPNSGAVGAISLGRELKSDVGELGYWLGVPFWGNGYMSEAACAMLGYGFGELDLSQIDAHHLLTNPASGRVMLKAGMQRMRTHDIDWRGNTRATAVFYSLDRAGWDKKQAAASDLLR